VREPVDLAGPETDRVEAVGHLHAPVGRHAEQLLDARGLAGRQEEQALAARGPPSHALRPGGGVRPAGRRTGSDRLEHEQLGAVDVADDRHVGGDPPRSFVHRRQVVEVQHVSRAGVRGRQHPRPRTDLVFEGQVVDGREDAVRRARPVLVRRVQRGVGAQRVGRRERGRHVHRADVEAGEERGGVRVAPGRPHRAADDRGVPPVGRQLPGEGARHVRRSAAWEEQQSEHCSGAPRRHRGEPSSGRGYAGPMAEPSVPQLEGDTPTKQPAFVDMLGGRQGVIDSVIPVTVFVAANAATRNVTTSALAAVASSLVLVVVRLIRHEPLKHVFSGVLGVGISAIIAIRMGKAKGVFLPGIVSNAVYLALFVGSVLLRRPIVGFLIRQISDKPAAWHDDPRVRRAYAEATLGWAGVFATRVLVVGYFALQDKTLSAGISKILLGPILYVVALLATMPYIKWRTRGLEPAPLAPAAGDETLV
jgi:hypothetical protein